MQKLLFGKKDPARDGSSIDRRLAEFYVVEDDDMLNGCEDGFSNRARFNLGEGGNWVSKARTDS